MSKQLMHGLWVLSVLFVGFGGGASVAMAASDKTPTNGAMESAKVALTVQTALPLRCEIPQELVATGSIVAWQEASVSSQSNGLPISKILVNVGDKVKKGQALAEFDSAALKTSFASAQANLNAAMAEYEQMKEGAEQSRALIKEGFISSKAARQSLTDEKTAFEKVAAARAQVDAQKLALANATVRAPAAGIISSRSAVLGAVMQSGQELFKLIVNNRLEWHANVDGADLSKIKVGNKVEVTTTAGKRVDGTVRMIGPTVNPTSRLGTVYVDLQKSRGHAIEAGMFAQGVFTLKIKKSMVIPQSALVYRDGYSYVYVLTDGSKVKRIKVASGERLGNVVQIDGGIMPTQSVVSSGAGFLNDGDLVRVNNKAPISAFECPAEQAIKASAAVPALAVKSR